MRALGPLEHDVMRVLWREVDALSGHAIAARLDTKRTVAYTTLLTVLDRLMGKQLVARRRDGRVFLYHATIPEADHAASLMTEVLASSANRHGALLRFAGQLDPAEADALRQALESPADGLAEDTQ